MSNQNNAVISERAREVLCQPIERDGTGVFLHVYRRIQQLIVEGELKAGDMVPSEAQLSQMMGVGRTSLRSALILLYEDGYVRTYRGRGTYVTYEPGKKRFSDERYLLPQRRMAESFRSYRVSFSSNKINSYDGFLDQELMAGGGLLYDFTRVYEANGIRTVLSYVYYPVSLLKAEGKTGDEIERMLEDIFDRDVAEVQCTVTAVPNSGVRGSESRTHMDGEHFLLVSSRWLNKDGKPLAYTKDYYNCDAIRLQFSVKK